MPNFYLPHGDKIISKMYRNTKCKSLRTRTTLERN